YYFVGWSGTETSSDRMITVSRWGEDVTATFQEYSVLTTNVNGSGTVSPNNGSKYKYGTNVSLKATPADGWIFTGWEGDASGTDTSTSIVMNGHKSVTAKFDFTGYTVTLDLGGCGTFDANGSNTITLTGVQPGTLEVPEYTLKDGYRFTGWDGSLNITRSITLKAKYDVQVTFVGNEQITITGTNPVWVSSGSSVTPPAYTVAEGYRFDGWDRSLSNITAPVTITAKPAVRQYRITLGVTGEGYFLNRNAIEGVWDVGEKLLLKKAVPLPDLGWVQTGWMNGNTGEKLPLNATITVTEDCTYYAVFESLDSRYVNAYAMANGKLGKNINGTYKQGTKINLNNAQPTATTPGYEFKYWEEYIDSTKSWVKVPLTNGQPIITVGVVNEYRAVFGLIDYTITFDVGAHGSTSDPTTFTVHYGDDFPDPPNITPNEGWVFPGWPEMPEKVTGSATYVAEYVRESFDVVFKNYDGTVLSSQKVNYNDYATAPATPSRGSGYHFIGWSSDGGATVKSSEEVNGTLVKADITYVACYEYRFKVTADSRMKDGGGGIRVTYNGVSVVLAPGASHTFTEVKGEDTVWLQGEPDEGYRFLRWNNPANSGYVDDNGKRPENIYEKVTFKPYALFEAISYPINYVLNGGTNNPANPDTYTIEDEVTLLAPTRTGYNFDGWSNGGKIEKGSIGEKEFSAAWTPISYTVRYDSNGGAGATADSTHVFDASGTLTANGFTREGHTFAGWATTPDGPVVYEDGASVMNLTSIDGAIVTLYAKWNINTYTVRFFDHTGTVQIGETQIVNWGGAAVPETPPARTGRTFTGWTLTGDDDTVETSLTNVRENIDAVATYALNRFTVTFVNYDGSVLGTDRVPYGGAATAPEVPGREGHTFTGWDTPFDNVTDDITVTALYRINTYTVRFVNYDGTVLSTQTVEWNTAATAPEVPEREDFTFTGWDADFSAVTEDMTVTAQFAPIETVENEPVPGTGDDSVATLEDEPVPQQGPAAFPWWWIVIGVGAALLLFLLIFFLVKRRKDEQTA
ncbi:MAG: InlB B-repeat-containing protein, partial [Christensenellales bacterium]